MHTYAEKEEDEEKEEEEEKEETIWLRDSSGQGVAVEDWRKELFSRTYRILNNISTVYDTMDSSGSGILTILATSSSLRLLLGRFESSTRKQSR